MSLLKQDTRQSQKARLQGLALFRRQCTMVRGHTAARAGRVEIDTAAPQPAGGPFGDLLGRGFSVPRSPSRLFLPVNQGLSLRKLASCSQGRRHSKPGVYITYHPNQNIFEREKGGCIIITPGPEVQPGKTRIYSHPSHKRYRQQRYQILSFQVKKKKSQSLGAK